MLYILSSQHFSRYWLLFNVLPSTFLTFTKLAAGPYLKDQCRVIAWYANCTRMAASRMQIAHKWQLAACKLHQDGAASLMQIAHNWQLTACKSYQGGGQPRANCKKVAANRVQTPLGLAAPAPSYGIKLYFSGRL